jgi:peptide/nickel transport system substrate-binding protein
MHLLRRHRSLVFSTAVLAAGALVAAGCSSVSTGSSSASTSTIPKVLTVAFGGAAETLDPNLAEIATDIDVLHLIGGNIFTLSNGKPTAGLAKTYVTSDNGLLVTIGLRPNLEFSNGQPLTSADVAATLERSKNNKANLYGGFLAGITSIDTPNKNEVVLHLSQPYPSLPTILAESENMILPKSDLNPATGTASASVASSPVSDGQYILKSWGGSTTVVMTANPHYWGPKPLIPKVVFVTIPDFNARIDQLRSGAVTMANAIPPALISALKGAPGISVEVSRYYGWNQLDINDRVAPLNNVNVRHAISLAVNRKELTTDALQGVVPPLAGFWPQTMTGYDPAISTTPNIAQAKQLLVGTPCAHGCTIQMYFETDDMPYSPQGAVILQNSLATIGIHLQLVEVENSAMGGYLSAGKYQMAYSNTNDFANIPDGLMLYGLQPAGGAMFSGYNSPTMNHIILEVDESSGARRLALLQQVDLQFAKDQPWVPLSGGLDVWLTRVSPKVAWLDDTAIVEVAGS